MDAVYPFAKSLIDPVVILVALLAAGTLAALTHATDIALKIIMPGRRYTK